jgi:acetyl-CoA carboxylase carboxyl transferase subunit alpha
MLANAVFSVASPETCASILLRDIKRADEMAEALRLNARALRDLGIIDEIIEEPVQEPLLDSPVFTRALHNTIKKHLDQICAQELPDLLDQRYRRLRLIGRYAQIETD